MAQKILPYNLEKLVRPEDNFFSLPRGMATEYRKGWIRQRATGLKPKTRYKVLVDNYPGNQFDDITDFSKPIGKSIKDNLHRSGRGRMTYLVSDRNGNLDFKTRPYGSDAAIHNGTLTTATQLNWSDLWTQKRSVDDDRGRDRIKLIEYSQVNLPDSDTRIKTLKVNIKNDDNNTARAALPPTLVCDCTVPLPGIDRPVLPQTRKVNYNFYQTFYLDNRSVDRSTTVDVTDVTLYVRRKPRKNQKSNTGIQDPGIRICIVECDDFGAPYLDEPYKNSQVRKSYGSIQASPLATVGTRFTFDAPITLKTNKFYAIGVILESDYDLWINTKGELLLANGVRTENISAGSSKEHKGDLYFSRSSSSSPTFAVAGKEGTWEPNLNKDLKFDVHVAEYDVDDVDINLVNEDYEFISLSNTSSNWAAGEQVFKSSSSNETGTVAITAGTNKIIGTGTSFNTVLKDGYKVAITDTSDPTKIEIFTVTTEIGGDTLNTDQPASATVVYVEEIAQQTLNGTYQITVVGEVDNYNAFYNLLTLRNSSVDTAQYLVDTNLRFAPGDTVTGVETGNEGYIDQFAGIPISVFRTNFNGQIPSLFTPSTDYKFAYLDTASNTYVLESTGNVMALNSPNHVKKYGAEIIGKSEEVDQISTAPAYADDSKSSVIKLSYTYNGAGTKSYVCPSFDLNELNIVAHRWLINNDSANEYTNKGNATTKHISKTFNLDAETQSEDLRVIANVYRPRGTSIEVYGRFFNSADAQSIEDKNWTKLTQISNLDRFSDKSKRFDYFETEYTIPSVVEVSTDLEGNATTTLSSTTITLNNANTTQLDALADGQVLKLSSELFPENFALVTVDSANSTTGEIVVKEPIANNNVVGDGFTLSEIAPSTGAFKNPLNDTVVRYFDSNGVAYDNFDKVAIKIVLLAETSNLVPKVDDYRVIALSA